MVRTKIECPECHRVLRIRCFKLNPILNKKICKYCDNKVGHNKFYNPVKTIYNKMEMTEDEKKALANTLMKSGIPYELAWHRVNQRQKYLNWFSRNHYWIKKGIKKIEIENREKSNEVNKQFLEGLGQLNKR